MRLLAYVCTCLYLCSYDTQVARISVVLTDGPSIWTGHADGSVTLVAPRAPPQLHYRHDNVHAPVCSMAVDVRGRCWVGHNNGVLQVLTAAGATLALLFSHPSASVGPLYAVACKEHLVFSTAGKHEICMWDCSSQQNSCKRLAQGDASGLGAATCLLPMDIDAQEAALQLSEAADESTVSGAVSFGLLSGHAHGQIVVWQVLGGTQLVKQAIVGYEKLGW